MEKRLAVLKSVTPLAKDIFEFEFSWKERNIDFVAGQFFLMNFTDESGEVSRAYSIAGSPEKNDGFPLCVKWVEGGKATKFFQIMKVGQEVEFSGPFGEFTVKDSFKDLLFVATGTGLAPFMSMLPSLLTVGSNRKIDLFFGVRSEPDLFYVDHLQNWAEANSNFKIHICLSQAESNGVSFHGRVTEALKEFEFLNREIFLCGNGSMVKEVQDWLVKAGHKRESIHTELFTPINI